LFLSVILNYWRRGFMDEQKTMGVMTEEEKYKYAKKRVEEIKGFYAHLIAYGAVNAALLIIWFVTTRGGYPWFFWVLGWWGFGLFWHAMGVFVFSKMEKGSWEQRKVREIMDKMDPENKK
jgi:hypothetical protein